MSKELDLAVTLIAYLKLIEFSEKVLQEETQKEKLGLRTEEDNITLLDLMNTLQLVGTKLKANMNRLAEAEDSHE